MLPILFCHKRDATQWPQVFEAGGKMRQQKATWESNLLKVLAQQPFLSMSGVATSRSIVFHDERCEHHSEQAPYQKLLGYRNPKPDTEIRKA
jgi:hypothetical protein